MDKKLISKIFAEIKKTPTSVTAYEDMFALCRNIEPEDFTLAHSTNEQLRKELTAAIKRRVNVEDFFALYKDCSFAYTGRHRDKQFVKLVISKVLQGIHNTFQNFTAGLIKSLVRLTVNFKIQ